MLFTSTMQTVLRYSLAYVFWLLTIALIVLVALVVRDSYEFFVAISRLHRYAAHAGNNFLTLLLGMVMLVALIFTEHWYRTGVANGKLVGRFMRVVALLLASVAIFHTLRVVGEASIGQWSIISTGIAVLEWVAAAALWRFSRAKL